MKRAYFFLVYALVFFALSPGIVLEKFEDFIHAPAAWQEALILVFCGLVFALSIIVAARVYRHLKLDFPLPSTDWRCKRILTIPFPGKRSDTTNSAPARNHYFRTVSLILFFFLSKTTPGFNTGSMDQHLREGYYLSARLSCLLRAQVDGDMLSRICNNNPVMFHSPEDHIRAVRFLLDKGCNPNIPDGFGRPVLTYVLGKEDQYLIPLLLEYGADVNHQSPYADAPIIHAARVDDIGLMRYLLEHGAQANAKSSIWNQSQTPLHIVCDAASENLRESVRLLLEAGADLNALDAKGCTPLDILEKRDVPAACDFLRTLGARKATELPLFLSAADADLTARLKAANPTGEDMELTGIIQNGNEPIPYTYHHTSKGNGFITVPGCDGRLSIRCYDGHDDGSIYLNYWAQITLEDKNADQHRDLVVSYTIQTLDDSGNETAQEHHAEAYLWNPAEKAFSAQ